MKIDTKKGEIQRQRMRSVVNLQKNQILNHIKKDLSETEVTDMYHGYRKYKRSKKQKEKLNKTVGIKSRKKQQVNTNTIRYLPSATSVSDTDTDNNTDTATEDEQQPSLTTMSKISNRMYFLMVEKKDHLNRMQVRSMPGFDFGETFLNVVNRIQKESGSVEEEA